jgi:hypothetical protein
MTITDLKERIAICADFSLDERHLLIDLVNTLPEVAGFSPPNYLPRIENIWAFLSVDEGGEGVVAAPVDGMTVPLIAADEARLTSLRPLARVVASKFDIPIRLVQFTERRELELIVGG